MIEMLAFRAVLLAALAGVQALSVVSAGDRTVVVIETTGQVTYEDELLTSPPRIVVDVSGADFRLPQRRFLDINRGGVLALRSAQFQPGVVRVVVDLAEAVDYQVSQDGNLISVSFPNPAGPFEPWTSGTIEDPAPQAAAQPQAPLGAPAAPQDRAGTPVPVSRPAVVEAPQQEQQPPIWVEFRNTPLTDVLGTFADFSGRSIVPGEGVENQTITATIQGQPWDEAMRAILAGQGLTATEMQSGIIMVTSLERQRAREEQEEVVTRAFQLQYVSADSIAPQVRSLLAAGAQGQAAGTVAALRATNTLVVSARQSVVDRVSQLIPDLDRRTPQVTIQARILSVRRSDFEGLGIHYEIKDSHGTMINRLTPGWQDTDNDGIFESGEQVAAPSEQVNLTGSTIAAVGNARERIPNPTFEVLSTLLIGRHALVTWIEAVERLELSELEAEPVITVLDHRTARIHVGERTPIRVIDQGAASDQGPTASVQTEETGVILEITPHVVGDQVLLQLHAERSEILSASADEGYVFGTSQTNTEILLNDGQTAVISGLTQKDLLRTQQGIPILMHLPLVGALFRNTFETEEQQDLLIMVTPYIDRAGGT